jgi:hypothetical protein
VSVEGERIYSTRRPSQANIKSTSMLFRTHTTVYGRHLNYSINVYGTQSEKFYISIKIPCDMPEILKAMSLVSYDSSFNYFWLPSGPYDVLEHRYVDASRSTVMCALYLSHSNLNI